MDLTWKDRDEGMRQITFVCPECGSTQDSAAGWKVWCIYHEMVTVWTNEGIVKHRRLVEMKPMESVNV